MTVEKFEKRLKSLIGELEESDLNTPVSAIVSTLKQEVYRLEDSRATLMHQMRGTY